MGIEQIHMSQDSVTAQDAVIIDRVELVVTEKCTLKCFGCADLMQYYTNPRTLETEKICSDFTELMRHTDVIESLNIIGGEPFIFGRLPEVIRCIMQFRDRIRYFEITTNGTIVPDDETLRAIKEAECNIKISDYGKLSRNKDELIAALKKHGVVYNVIFGGHGVWRYVQKIVSPEGNDGQKMYAECHAHCKTVKDGRLYRCPFLAHGETLCAFPYDERNHIDLDEYCTGEKIKRYIESKTAPPGCYYCNGNYSGDALAIPVAEQTEEPVPYRRYDV